MTSMYSPREQAADRFNHSPEAEQYRRATAGPLDGPFMTSLRLTDYSDDEEFAILPADADDEGERMAREDRQS